MIKTYKITRRYSTGIEKPHTIELDTGRKVSIVYYNEKYIKLPGKALAIADDGTTYRIFENDDCSKMLAIKVEV